MQIYSYKNLQICTYYTNFAEIIKKFGKMKKFLFPSLVILAILIGFWIGSSARAQRMWQFTFPPQQSKIEQMLGIMQAYYVDSVNTDSLIEVLANDLASKLDPHSSYISKKDLELVNSQLEGSFSGIGVQFSIQNDTVCIVSVVSGGPSDGTGILAGDKIIEVDDSVFTGKKINNEKVMHTLRGESGTQVKLGIARMGTKETLHFTITRGKVPTYSVVAKFMATPEIGFIRVDRFGENTYEEFLTALNQLRWSGAKSFIIDLRSNSGGYLDRCAKMVNEFLPAGRMIVYSEGRSYQRSELKALGNGRFQKEPVVVLIDEFSASASEIFSGALQDNDRATIIGRRSFGKGLVQNQISLSDGSAIRLTVARYYIPSGRCIQKPYTMGEGEEYQKSFNERFEHGEAYNKDSIHLTDTTKYYTREGRVVYGGGGIMPDIFLPVDTSLNTPYFNIVSNRAYIYQFALDYVNRNRSTLSKYKKWQELEKYLLRQPVLDEFVKFCQKKEVEPKTEQIEKSKPLLIRNINATIVRDMLGDEGFFPLYERDDYMTKRAIEELSK